MTTLTALIAIIRPVNALITGVAVLLGLQLGRGETSLVALIFGPLSAALIAAFANINNDIADIPIDRVNRPTRPLPSGNMSLKTAFILSMAALTTGLLTARVCGRTELAVAGGVTLWLVLYNRWGKRRLLVGNVMVAIAGGMPLLYAGIITDPAPGRWQFLWLGFLLGFAFHLAREVLKDIQDVEGDTRVGLKTVPIAIGVPLAIRLSGAYLVLIAFLAIVPFILLWFNTIYLYGLVAFIIIPSAVGCYRLCKNSTSKEAGRWSTVTKVMMAVGLVLLWLGAK